MANVVLSLGGNDPRSSEVIDLVPSRLAQVIQATITHRSSVQTTKPWGPIQEQPDFLNQVLLMTTNLSPLDLLDSIKQLEVKLGRVSTDVRYGPRLIDIDILAYDNIILVSEILTIPHPHIGERPFLHELLKQLPKTDLPSCLHQYL